VAARSFGKRVGPGQLRAPTTPPGVSAPKLLHVPPRQERTAPPPAPTEPGTPVSIEDELKAWKQSRRRERPFKMPWRQLSLIASLSFGIASFVLPASVNEAAGWLLDFLAVGAFLAWIGGRRRTPQESGAELPTAPHGA